MKRGRRQSIGAAVAVGDLVYLRRAVRSDREEWVALREGSEAFLRPWNPEPPPGQARDGRSLFRRTLKTTNTTTEQRHLVCRIDDDAIVGMANVFQIFRGPFQNGIMGWWCGEPFVRRGYTKDAVRALVGHAFRSTSAKGLGLHRVEANIKPDNEPSLRVAGAVGMRREGLSLRYLQINGEWADHVRFALTVEDWRAIEASD